MRPKTNWDFLRKQKTEEKTGFRNVHENQHLERKQLGEMRSAMPIAIGSVFLGVFVFLMIWIPLSFLNPPVNPEDAVGDVKPGVEVPSDMPSSYFVKETDRQITPSGPQDVDVYYEVDQNGNTIEEPSYSSPSDIDPPEWYTQYYDVDVDDLGTAIVYPNEYFAKRTDFTAVDGRGTKTIEYRAVDEQGEVIDEPVYYSEDDVPIPDWWDDALAQQAESGESGSSSDSNNSDESQSGGSSSSYDADEHGSARDDSLFGGSSSFDVLFHFTFGKFMISASGGLLVGMILYAALRRQLDAENLMYDVTDINQHENDQHIMLVEELLDNFDVFPDAGFESGVNVTAMISHIHLDNKGLNNVDVSVRHKKDVLDEDGDIEYHKGEVVYDDDDNIIFESVPVFDTDFSTALFEASGAPGDNDKLYRKKYNPSKIPYNPDGKNRDKLGKYDTVADLINKEWEIPWYEVQRPAGVYIVDTTPSNTLVVAMTRAGKGQTLIEPTIDMWTRQKNRINMVINDPKGELLCKFYAPGTVRGHQIVQFNLMNVMNTDIYNPLTLAAESARAGDNTKTATYVGNISEVFFPVDGGDDPVWPNAASNAFKRASYGLIDYFLEEETELRNKAIITGLDPTVLETRLDDMWGKVTLYNCYQLFVQLTSKKLKNPAKFKDPSLNADLLGIDANEYIGVVNDIEGNGDVDLINARLDGNDYVLSHDKSHGQDLGEAHTELMKYLDENLWEGADDKDMLTLYFNAVKCLPRNSIRTLVGDADNALKSMAGAEKMLASVYGIAITGMAFFTDPTISTLTSGRPSQNVDLATLAFPRALGVRFDKDYVAKHSLVGKQAVWSAYEDFEFTKKYEGEDFSHENLINETGWAKFYFKGIFPNDVTYLRCEIIDVVTRQVIEVFHYKFTKGYQRNFAGDKLVKDPVLREKVVLNGVMEEITYDVKVSEVRINHPDNNYKAEDEALRKAGKMPRLYNMYEPDDVGAMSIVRPGVVRTIKPVKRKIKDKSAAGKFKTVVKYFEEVTTYSYGRASFKSKRIITNSDNESEIKDYDSPITTQTDVRYCEKPKMIFLVTPPHLMAYAKLILILLKQLVELNFDQSYLTKSSQKPLYRTCYMIDELGNLQSEGNGISNLETYLSIGLGQEQQFTLILQTLQQLRDGVTRLLVKS